MKATTDKVCMLNVLLMCHLKWNPYLIGVWIHTVGNLSTVGKWFSKVVYIYSHSYVILYFNFPGSCPLFIICFGGHLSFEHGCVCLHTSKCVLFVLDFRQILLSVDVLMTGRNIVV